MSAEQTIIGAYFETPARAERMQLLIYLARNAGDVIYLRAPAGAGKTRFVHRMIDDLDGEMTTVWVRAGRDSDVPAATMSQLGLEPSEIIEWPERVLEAAGDQGLFLIVDDADKLDLPAIESLSALHAGGGRLLLLGHGGLAHTTRDWDAQFVDLPSFDAVQTTAFLRAQAGEEADRITEDLSAALHRAAHGLPGPLLDGLNEVLSRARKNSSVEGSAGVAPAKKGRPVWQWLAGGLALTLLVTVLLFQDRINAVFEPENAGVDRPATVKSESLEANQDMAPSTGPEEAAPAEDLYPETVVAPMPEVSLPQLTAAADEPAAASVDTSQVSAPAAQRTAPSQADDVSAELAPSDPGSDKEDPLEAVMRDALAAEAGEDSDPTTSKPANDRGPQPTNLVATKASVVKEQSPHEIVSPAADLSPGTLAVNVADTPQKPVAKEAQPAVKTLAPVPAPVESRQAPPAKPAVTKAKAPPAEVVSATAPRTGDRWLKSREPGHYTLQLVGARDRAAVQKFVRDKGVKAPYAIFARDLEGKPWYSLVAGDYRNRDAAIAARGRLPKRLERSGVWPRTFESIQKAQ